MKLTLRPYQEEALARVAAAEARGVRAQLGVAACGLGKTVVFCALAERRGGRTLILAHRDELISQAVAKVGEVWPDAQVGVVKADRNEVRAQVVVASVQTLARPKRLAELCAPWTDGGLLGRAEPFSLVVVDEAHHSRADTYVGIIGALRAGQPGCMCGQPHERSATPEEVSAGCELGVAYDPCPMLDAGPLLLGVTATPDRGDGKGLDDIFAEIVFSYDLLWGIRAGYLSDLRGRRVTVDTLDMSGVKVRRGDYDQGQAGRAMEDAQAERYVVKAWQEHAADRRTLVFTPTVEVARLVADEFTHAGVAAAYVHGGTPIEDRRRLLADYSAGRILVLANCAVLTEGTDLPATSCIVMARPTRSRALYAQCVGRVARRHPDKDFGLVLDVVGASAEHSLVTVPSLFGLDKGYADRMSDGTGDLAGVVQERDDELVRVGKLRAEDADLFRAMRAEGVAWVQVHHDGAELRRYVRTLGKDKDGTLLPTVVLAQRVADGDVWTAGLWWPNTGAKRVLLAEVTMELAQGVGEDYVRKFGSVHLTQADAKWKAGRPRPGQLQAAAKWRLKVDKAWTAGELSEHLDAHIVRLKLRQADKAKAAAPAEVQP